MFQPGDDITVEITTLAGLGDGVGYMGETKVFVPFTAPGDKVHAVVQKTAKGQVFTHLKEIITPGQHRATPPCRHFYRCGGCSLQHVAQETYAAFKRRMLEEAVARAGYDTSVVQAPVLVGSHARRRAQWKVQGSQVGYYQPKSHTLVAIEECPLLEPALERLVAPVNAFLQTFPKPEAIKEIALFNSDSGVDMLFISSQETWDSAMYAKATAFAEAEDIARVSYRCEAAIWPIAQRRPVVMQAGDISIELPPGAFQQATKGGQEAITAEIRKAVGGASRIIDLYAGCGTYTFPLAANAKVYAVEGDPTMVQAILHTATKQALPHIGAEVRDLFRQPVPAANLQRYDAVVVNPPRNGAGTQAAEIAKSGVPIVVMVSCNPVTFADDAKRLRTAGYSLEKATPIDQFVWNSHLELVAVFKK